MNFFVGVATMASLNCMVLQYILNILFLNFYLLHGTFAQMYLMSSSTERPVPNRYTIGAVLSPNQNLYSFEKFVRSYSYTKPEILFEHSAIAMDTNPIRTAKRVCEKLVQNQVYAVIVGQPDNDDLNVASVSYTCGFYNIPVVGIRTRDSAFSDKNVHPSFIRTVPPYSFQADMWVQLLKHLKYEKVVFIHSADTDGRASYTRFVNAIDDTKIKIESSFEFEPGQNISLKLREVFSFVSSRIILVYCSAKDSQEIFSSAEAEGLTTAGFVWFVTEQALQAPNIPDGVLGLELPNAFNSIAHIHDAVDVIVTAIKKMFYKYPESIVDAPSSCNGSFEDWVTGKNLLSQIKKEVLLGGKTGRIGFDEHGDRIYAEYNIINVVNKSRLWVGNFTYSANKESMKLELMVDKIIWPGSVTEKPLGYHVPTRLNVVTVTERPFVLAELAMADNSCGLKIPCKKYNKLTDSVDDYCCYGYCMELLRKLSKRLNFSYDVHLEPDNIFGMPVRVNGSTEKRWTGLIAELLNGQADMAVAALTITPERSQVIDFTKPFKYQGITILEKIQHKSSLLSSFLQPFQTELWILVMVSVHVVALALYLLDRFSPFGRYKLPNSDATEEDALNLSSAIWFAWGVLLNSGIGEGTPRSFSARVLGMVWAGFAMIVVASYTANLAAFLVLDRPDTSLSGINDARLRNPVENFTYATVKKSSVDMYFQKQVELSNMYRTMEGKNYDTVEEAVDAVKKDQLNAFIWDSARLDYEAAQDCSLETTGELFGRSGIGVGFVKDSYWAEPTTLAILEMHENGFMEELDKEWIYATNRKCDQPEKGPVTLGLKNMGGVFILVGAGIVGGIGLIIIEIVYKKHQTNKQKKMELARHAADKWRGAVEKRKILRASIESQKRLKTNGMEILASSSLDKHYNAIPDPTSTSTSHFSSFRPLPSPEVRLRNQHGSGSSSFASGGLGIRPIYKSQDFVV